jgi:hypothetical protein
MAVWYAFKQSDTSEDGTSSSGWETLLDGMIRSGWSITATWPSRSERAGRMLSVGTNALASSIVLALRPRPADAPTTDRRGLIAADGSHMTSRWAAGLHNREDVADLLADHEDESAVAQIVRDAIRDRLLGRDELESAPTSGAKR